MSGIYLHIPFCDTKCIYCDFYSITNHDRKSEFIECLIEEIKKEAPKLKDKKFDTVFFGGGTPSLLNFVDFDRIFETLYSSLNIDNDSEITIEANPGTLNQNKLREFLKLPVNRISFGIQSFIERDLRFLSRIHSVDQAVNSIKTAQELGFTNINFDLIFAVPGQTMDNWQFNMETAVNLNTPHISVYSLIFEEGTPLFNLSEQKKVTNIPLELEREMYDYTMEYLNSHDFKQYEISNYAKKGFECKHNLKYWEHKEYIGFGPSAASYLDNYRRINVRNLTQYIDRIKNNNDQFDFIEYIDKQTSKYEFIMLGLRSKGIDFKIFRNRYNEDFKSKYQNTIKLLTNEGFADICTNKFRLTRKGYAMCDEILATYF